MLRSDRCRSSGACSGPARELLANGGSDRGAEQLDRAHGLLVRQRADADLRHKALVSEEVMFEEDLLDDLSGISSVP